MRLIDLRKTNKLTQQNVADYLNVTQTTYNYYEKGKSEPNINTLCKLADLYNVSIDYLVDRNFDNHFVHLSKEQKQIVILTQNLNINYLNYIISFIKGLTTDK